MSKNFIEFIKKIEDERLSPLRDKFENEPDAFKRMAIYNKIQSTETSLQLLEEYHQWLSN